MSVDQPQFCGCGGNHMANFRGKRGRTHFKLCARALPKERHQGSPRRSEISAVQAFCRVNGPGRELESRRPKGRVAKAIVTPHPKPNPSLQPVTKAPTHSKVPATRRTAGPIKPKPKSIAATKPAARKTKKKTASSVITVADNNPRQPN